MKNKTILVCGAAGFIGNHMVDRLKMLGNEVIGVDLHLPKFNSSKADFFYVLDLTDPSSIAEVLMNHPKVDWIFQFSANMGGAMFVFTGENDADIMSDSASINLNILRAISGMTNPPGIFFSSSACAYPYDGTFQSCIEDSMYPARPDSEYGWEKLFSERLYQAFRKNYGINTKIARYHNIFGTHCSWDDGREKSPAAICRKVAECPEGGAIEIIGDGTQVRSYLYIDDCLDGTLALCASPDFHGPVNIGSEKFITINGLVHTVSTIAEKRVKTRFITGPVGVCGRTSHNKLVKERLGWEPKIPIEDGFRNTYRWIKSQVDKKGLVK